jgi:putative PIN family toxin of toxin-antitoxin system
VTEEETGQTSEEGATGSLRAVLDTNVFVAAYLSRNPRSPNKELIQRWRAGEFTLLISEAILKEIAQEFQELGIDQQLTIELIAHIIVDARQVDVAPEDVQSVIVQDPDDDQIIACAVAGNADYLVTYDPHFDVLEGEYQGIRILDGLHFLYVVRGDVRPADRAAPPSSAPIGPAAPSSTP